MSTSGMPIPLIPDPLIPLKEKTSGINGRGLKRPLSDSVDSGERESTGIDGNQRAGLNAWTDADITAFLERQSRLVRLGWSALDAERLAERLVLRDRGGDTRVACVECRHYRLSRCGNHRAAGKWAADVGRDLATLPQHCPGFMPLAYQPVAATGRNNEEAAP